MLFPEHEIEADFASCHKLIYGHPGTGKTTLASQMKDDKGRVPFFIMTEDGLGSLKVNYRRTTSWDGFRRLVEFLQNNKAQLDKECSTIVVDVLGDLDKWAASWVAIQKRVEYVGDLDMGKGWKLLSDQLEIELAKLMALAPTTFIAHTEDKERLVNGEKFTGQSPALGKACFKYVTGKVDVIMWIEPASSKRATPVISMRPSTGAVAKARQGAIAKDYPYDPQNNPSQAYTEISRDYAEAQRKLMNQVAADAPALTGDPA